MDEVISQKLCETGTCGLTLRCMFTRSLVKMSISDLDLVFKVTEDHNCKSTLVARFVVIEARDF